MSKVYQYQWPTRCFQIVDNLSSIFVRQILHRLDFKNDAVKTEKIRRISLFELASLVLKSDPQFLDKRDALLGELNSQTFLIHGFQKSVSLLFINIKTGPDDSITLFLENNIRSRFRAFRVFRSLICLAYLGFAGT